MASQTPSTTGKSMMKRRLTTNTPTYLGNFHSQQVRQPIRPFEWKHSKLAETADVHFEDSQPGSVFSQQEVNFATQNKQVIHVTVKKYTALFCHATLTYVIYYVS